LGAFIVFEGGDGAGKSTQARLLFRRLARQGCRVVLTREPGGTPVGRAARRWLKGGSGITPLAELLLFAAARAENVDRVIAPALETQHTVICDRFTGSTLAYQGYGRGLDMELIHQLNALATRGLRPDLTILLDMPPEPGLARKRRSDRDRFESEDVEFHRRVREGYRSLASRDGWAVLDGTLQRRVLAGQVWKSVQPILEASRTG
jgi:dTMP kinase